VTTLHKRTSTLILLLTILIGFAGASFAVPTTLPGISATVTGTVTSTAGMPLSGAQVVLYNSTTSTDIKSATTDANGVYTIGGILPGDNLKIRVEYSSIITTWWSETFSLGYHQTKTINPQISLHAMGIKITAPMSGVISDGASYITLTVNVTDKFYKPVADNTIIKITIRPYDGSHYAGSLDGAGNTHSVTKTTSGGKVYVDFGWVTPEQEAILGTSWIDVIASTSDGTVDGKFTVKLKAEPTVTGGGQKPVPGYTCVPGGGTSPLTVHITDASLNSPTSWDWDFGDSTAHSHEQNPTHVYTNPGSYSITLTVANAAGSATKTFSNKVDVTASGQQSSTGAPVAAFEYSPHEGTVPLAVGFADRSTNSPTSWSWSFGDGGSTNDQNPSHTFTTPGTYAVVLTASNAAGSNSISQLVAVTASGGSGQSQNSSDDTTPPVSAYALWGTRDGSGAYQDYVTFSMDATDYQSGVKEKQYSSDGVNWTTFSNANGITFNTPGEFVVYFRSIDNAGNVEAAQHVTFSVMKAIQKAQFPCLSMVILPLIVFGMAAIGTIRVKKPKK
jgi:PKD repeat protein